MRSSVAVQPSTFAIQSPISTIPCNSFYLLANPMLPFSMLSPSIDGFRLYPEPRRARPTLPHPAFPVTFSAVPCSPNLCASVLSSPNPYLFNSKLSTFNRLSPDRPNPFTIRTSEKRASNPCRMRSFKTQDLKPFRMCSSEKTGVGEGQIPQVGQPILAVLFEASPARIMGHRPRSTSVCFIARAKLR